MTSAPAMSCWQSHASGHCDEEPLSSMLVHGHDPPIKLAGVSQKDLGSEEAEGLQRKAFLWQF